MNEMSAKNKWEEVVKEGGYNEHRNIDLGQYYTHAIDHDIKQFGFRLSRYKFASKMIETKNDTSILELGCNHGLGALYFAQTNSCKRYLGVDFDHDAIAWGKKNLGSDQIQYLEDDFLNKDYRGIYGEEYDAIVSIDVIEHIRHDQEDAFLHTIKSNLKKDGVAIIGTPNITMDPYASAESKVGHINLFDQRRLCELLKNVFDNVFIFGMTDEVVHTGFYPFCCYIMAVCAGK